MNWENLPTITRRSGGITLPGYSPGQRPGRKGKEESRCRSMADMAWSSIRIYCSARIPGDRRGTARISIRGFERIGIGLWLRNKKGIVHERKCHGMR